MTQSICPLCGSLECEAEATQSGPAAVRYWCQQNCDTFRMSAVFLKYVMPAMKREDKKAIVAYMQATKGPQRAAPLIQGDNYMEYVTQGRNLSISASENPPFVAK